MLPSPFPCMRQRLEYALAWLIIKIHRRVASSSGARRRDSLGLDGLPAAIRLRRVGMRNLTLAFPERAATSVPEFCAAYSPPSAVNWRRSAFSPSTRSKMSAKSWSTTDLRTSSAP